MRFKNGAAGRHHDEVGAAAALFPAHAADDVALTIQAHAGDATLAKLKIQQHFAVVAHTAMFVDRIRQQLAHVATLGIAIRHIQRFFVGGEQHGLWANGVISDAIQAVVAGALRVRAQHRRERQHGRGGWAVRRLRVVGVGYPHAAFFIDGHVARLVVAFTVQKLGDGRGRTIVQKLYHTAATFLRAKHRTVIRNGKAIHTPGPAAKVIHLVRRRVETQHAFFQHRAEQHALTVPRQSTGTPLDR